MSFTGRVQHYYDSNTTRFEGHESAVCDAVHRGVWAPGVHSQQQAFGYVNELILQVARSLPQPLRVLDMGCGIGGTLFALGRALTLEGLGVTLSPVQVEMAQLRAQRLGLASSCQFVRADYLHLPTMAPRSLAYAVESFVHGPDPERFFESAAGALQAGGYLVMCDDFLTGLGAEVQHTNSRQGRLLHDFRRGWQVGSLVTVDWARRAAARFGLELLDGQNLTPHLRLRTLWDRWISLCVQLFGGLPYSSPGWDSWVGSHGVQMGLVEGLLEYQFLVFRRTSLS